MSPEIHLAIKLGLLGFLFMAFIVFAIKFTIWINVDIDADMPDIDDINFHLSGEYDYSDNQNDDYLDY